MRLKSILTSLLLGAGALGLSVSVFAVEPAMNTHNQAGVRNVTQAAKPTVSANSPRVRRMRLNDNGNRALSLPRETMVSLQTTLQNEGHYKGEVDGIEGPQTRRAVRQYQQQRQLEVTGQLDNETLRQLGISAPDITADPVSGVATGTDSGGVNNPSGASTSGDMPLGNTAADNTPSNMKAPSGTFVSPGSTGATGTTGTVSGSKAIQP